MRKIWKWMLGRLPGRCSQCGKKHQESQGLLKEISEDNELRLFHCPDWCEAYYSFLHGVGVLRSYLGLDELEKCRELEEWTGKDDKTRKENHETI